jgi:hypothetical protein
VTGTVNPLPEAPTMGGNGNAYCGSGTITATFGSNGNGIRWTDNNTTESPRTVDLPGPYYAVATSAAGCESSTVSVSVTIKPVPDINHSGGAGSQNVNMNTAIAPMTYTATNSAVMSMTGGSFPAGITGTPSGSSFTISGTPTAAGTFWYSLTATAANGCTRTAAGAFTVNIVCPTNVPTTLCPQCGWDGAAWVDCCVTTTSYPFTSYRYVITWNGNGTTFYPGASGSGSDKNGRANTAAIPSSTSVENAVQACKDLGAGWYLPAYEELVNMSGGYYTTPLNGRGGARLLVSDMGTFLSSTEGRGNGGRLSYDTGDNVEQQYAITVNHDGKLDGIKKDGTLLARCAWRP